MGLDVYLEKCADRQKSEALRAQYYEQSEAIWSKYLHGRKYEQLSQDEKNKARSEVQALAAGMGLGEFGEDASIEKIEISSERYPDHLFKVGYFRSSYNSGGIDNVLRRISLPDLAEIMGYDNEGEFVPDWEASLTRVKNVISALADKPLSFDVMEVAASNLFGGDVCTSESEARELYLKENSSEQKSFRSYSKASGEYYLDGKNVRAFIRGKDYFKRDCLYVVYDTDGFDWYKNALEIVAETCEYVIAQSDRKNYYLSWSG